MSFGKTVKEEALVASGRCCCICHKFCGIKIEVHHIVHQKADGTDDFDNAIPLCFDCHADMTSYDFKHPKGNKYSESELKRLRDNWYKKVKGNIGIADIHTVVETDKVVYKKLIKNLPWEGSISFIKTFNFNGYSFELKNLDDLYNFLNFCENPNYEFIDPDLEIQKITLKKAIIDFCSIIENNTFSTNSPYYNAVPDEWVDTQPERFEKTVKNLHSSSYKIVNLYSDFVRTAVRKLGEII